MILETTFSIDPKTGTNNKAINNEEIRTQIKVIGKYFINSPAIPGQKIKGIKAARVVAVEEIIGNDIFFDAFAKASFTLNPSFIFLSAYSTTTIAPSTKRPTDSINAKSTTMLIVKPIMERANKPDKKDPGIEIPTSKPDLTPRAPSIIIKTSIIVL